MPVKLLPEFYLHRFSFQQFFRYEEPFLQAFVRDNGASSSHVQMLREPQQKHLRANCPNAHRLLIYLLELVFDVEGLHLASLDTWVPTHQFYQRFYRVV